VSKERERHNKNGTAGYSDVDLPASLKLLLELVGESPDRARKVRNGLFRDGKLRAGVLSIHCLTAGRTDEAILRFNLGNRFRELVATLATGEIDGKIAKKV